MQVRPPQPFAVRIYMGSVSVQTSSIGPNPPLRWQALLKHYDPKNMTMIPYEYFIKDLSGPLTGHRLALVTEVWKLLDKDNSGYVDRPECAALYVAHLHPDVLEGIHDLDFVSKRFADELFQGSEHLTWEDFKNRHAAMSVNIEEDSAFNLYIHDTWDLAGTRNRLANLDQYTHPVDNKPQTYARDVEFRRRRHGDHLQPGCKAHVDWEPPHVDAVEEEPEWMKPKGLAVEAMQKLRAALKKKSVRGIFAIPVIFRSHDSAGDGWLSFEEFRHAFHGMNLGLSDAEIDALFHHFDHPESMRRGSVQYEEFVDGVRGRLNSYKLAWVRAVFQFLDVDHSGTIPLDDLRTKYDAKNHPMVHKGLMSREEIYLEFLDTFIDAAVQQPVSGAVNWEMFHNYYAMLGAQAPSDEHFAAVIQGTWGIGVDAVFDPHAPSLPAPPQPPFPKKVFGTQLTTPGEFIRSGKPIPKPIPPFGSEVEPPRPPTMAENALTVGLDVLMDRVRKAISCTNNPAMAGRTIIGCDGFGESLQREEKLNGGALDGEQLYELLLKVFVPLNAAEALILHKAFASDTTGNFDPTKFVNALKSHLSMRRKKAVVHAFRQLDVFERGQVNMALLRVSYSAHRHPDVLAGRVREEDEIRRFQKDFLGGRRDGVVTFAEFNDYYSNKSANIENDDAFCMLVWNTWDGASAKGGSRPPPGRSNLLY